jgi:hypothetical protein
VVPARDGADVLRSEVCAVASGGSPAPGVPDFPSDTAGQLLPRHLSTDHEPLFTYTPADRDH